MYSIEPPNFPEFITDRDSHITQVYLDAFKGFQIRNGMYGAVSSTEVSSGFCHVIIEDQYDQSIAIAHIEWIKENQKALSEVIIDKLALDYPGVREEILEDYEPEDAARLLPVLESKTQIKELCGVVAIYLAGFSKCDIPYFGIEMASTWEEEHGIGFLLYGTQIVKYGQAAVSFDPRPAMKHAEKL